MFLKSDRSVRQNPGSRTDPGRPVVMVVWLGEASENTVGLNHCVNWCGAPAFGSPFWLARITHGDDPRQPAPVGSMSWGESTVRGNPVWNVWIPDTSHPPNTCPTNPCCGRSHGIT